MVAQLQSFHFQSVVCIKALVPKLWHVKQDQLLGSLSTSERVIDSRYCIEIVCYLALTTTFSTLSLEMCINTGALRNVDQLGGFWMCLFWLRKCRPTPLFGCLLVVV